MLWTAAPLGRLYQSASAHGLVLFNQVVLDAFVKHVYLYIECALSLVSGLLDTVACSGHRFQVSRN